MTAYREAVLDAARIASTVAEAREWVEDYCALSLWTNLLAGDVLRETDNLPRWASADMTGALGNLVAMASMVADIMEEVECGD